MALEIQMTFGLCRWPASNSMCRLHEYVFSQIVRPPGILADSFKGNQTGQVVGDGFIRPRIYISYSLSLLFWKLLLANVPLDIMNLTVFLQLRGNPRSSSKSST
jgi:hypothetical protein